MSTKIFTGFQIATSSLPEVYALIDAFRPRIERESRQIMKRFIDGAAPGDHLKGWMTWLELRKATVENGIRHPAVDTEFHLVLFPDGDRFLGIAFTEQPSWFRQWLQQPKVSEFGYWNCTDDTPEGVSYEDFSKRREVWDRLVGSDPPSMRGFAIHVTDPNGPALWKLFEEEQAAAAESVIDEAPSPGP